MRHRHPLIEAWSGVYAQSSRPTDVITTLKLVSLQEVVRGEVTRQARVIAAFDTCCGAKPWKVVLGMLLERNWRGTGRESRALYTLGDQGHAGARCNIGVFFLHRI